MRYQRLDLNLLVALKNLLQERNVTRAAQSLHVTQSAMSGILARLREYFDDPLIVQVGRRMELSPLGESLVEPLGDLLMRIDATLGTRPEFNPSTTHRRFRIVASDYSVHVLLTDVLRAMHISAPQVRVDIHPPSDEAAALLEAGEIDLTIMPQMFASAAQAQTVLWEDSFCAVVDADHPDVSDSMSLAQFMNARHVAFESFGRGVFETWFARTHGELPGTEVTVHGFSMLAPLVVGTARIATMHRRLADLQIEMGLPLRRVALEFPTPPLVQVMQWHSVRELDPGSQWLREQLMFAAGALLPVTS